MKKGFKRTEVGVIPEEWEVMQIAKVGSIHGRVGWKGYTVKDLRSSGVYTIGAKHIDKQNRLDLTDPTFLSQEKFLESPEIMVFKNDILIVQRGTIGKIVLIDKEIGDATINPSMLIFRLKLALPQFAYYHLISRNGQNQILNDTSSTGVPMITQKQVLGFKIPIPTIVEQTAIATALSNMDALITLTEKRLQKKKDLKQGLMQELLKPKEGWEVRKLGEVGAFKNGINKGEEDFGFGFPFVNLMDVFGKSKVENGTSLGLVNSNPAERKTYELIKGDVLFIRSSVKPSGVGLTAVVSDNLPNTVYSGFLIRFRDNGSLDFGFKAYCFHEEGFRKRLIDNSTVSANTNINQNALKRLEITLPPLETQTQIAKILSDADAEIHALETKITKLRAQKQGMMQALLTGKIRLTE
jgi:type I restriction enzyme S subunit